MDALGYRLVLDTSPMNFILSFHFSVLVHRLSEMAAIIGLGMGETSYLSHLYRSFWIDSAMKSASISFATLPSRNRP
jgi:hypothetical protein